MARRRVERRSRTSAQSGDVLATWRGRLHRSAGGLIVAAVVIGPLLVSPEAWSSALHHGLATAFAVVAVWRFAVIVLAKERPDPPPLPDAELPSYTVVAPLFREAGMVDQLVSALDRLEYPRDRLQVILALEAVDLETVEAVSRRTLPAAFEVLVVPPGQPQTKPRACNVALNDARGELLTIYDAEDRPEPGQLRQAAAAFAANSERLGCLQAPLRISNSQGFLAAQFANEYAAQFELLLPAMARLGLPFPLGGTSNHLRRTALDDVGGWDAWNVTEDADLGFRLAAHGWRLGVIRSPTWENAPTALYSWLPQRSRWLKGYLQTLGVHLRLARGRPRILLGMTLTLGLAIGSSAVHGPAFAWLVAYLLFWSLGGPGPSLTPLDLTALGAGWTAAIASGAFGAKRAGLPVRLRDAVLAPVYWPLLTCALWHGWTRLVFEPHRWDKTDHTPWAEGQAA